MITIQRQLVRAILQSPFDLKWSVQGLGLLRTYLSPEVRLHIWDSSLRVDNVSPLHTHPWHLASEIIAGKLKQHRYIENSSGESYSSATIKCGENACTLSPTIKVGLEQPLETYYPGEKYSQFKDEIHNSLAEDGTVTIVERTFFEDRDTARVFWKGDGPFVSAEPRAATREEIERVTQKALKGF